MIVIYQVILASGIFYWISVNPTVESILDSEDPITKYDILLVISLIVLWIVYMGVVMLFLGRLMHV